QRDSLASLQQAISLYRGAFLEGCSQAWVLGERQKREEQYLKALETLSQHALASRDDARAIGHLRQALAVAPGRESACCALMQALAHTGDYAGLTQVYRQLRDYLHRELHQEPALETRRLYQQVMAQARCQAQMPAPALI